MAGNKQAAQNKAIYFILRRHTAVARCAPRTCLCSGHSVISTNRPLATAAGKATAVVVNRTIRRGFRLCSFEELERTIYSKCNFSQNSVHYKDALARYEFAAKRDGKSAVVLTENTGTASSGLDAVAAVGEKRRVVNGFVMFTLTKLYYFVIAICFLLELFVRGEARRFRTHEDL